MYQIVIARKLQGRGIFVTEDRNEPNVAPTPTPDGRIEERPVILGRKLAAKERRTLLEVRNKMKDHFGGTECHISPTAKGGGSIEGLCMACPVCYTHGGLRSGKGGNYGHAGIVLYDDAFSFGDSEIENLTLNAVDTKTYRTGTALATETFLYGGTFINVITIKHDAKEVLDLILDSILSTNSYGARTRHYGRMKNEIIAILEGERPVLTSYELIGKSETMESAKQNVINLANKKGAKLIDIPDINSKSHKEIMLAVDRLPEVQEWYREVKSYLG